MLRRNRTDAPTFDTGNDLSHITTPRALVDAVEVLDRFSDRPHNASG
jgi:hypothetical protein